MATNGPTAQNGAAKQAPRMTLSAVKRGTIVRPMRILAYGTEGVGKSTFAAGAPSPIFIGTEDGTAQLDVARFPEPKSWQDVFDAVAALKRDAHDYKTVVVDTLDWAEPLCWQHVCAKAKKENIEAFGYGKGYIAALDLWRELLETLSDLRAARGMHIVLLAHANIRQFHNPEGDDFDRYELKLHAKAGGLCKEWCDAVLFMNYETFAVKDGNRVRGVGSGARYIHTERRAAYDAKNRYGLPERIELSWDAFANAVAGADNDARAKAITERIEEMLGREGIDERLATTVRETVEKCDGVAVSLAKVEDRLRAKLEVQA